MVLSPLILSPSFLRFQGSQDGLQLCEHSGQKLGVLNKRGKEMHPTQQTLAIGTCIIYVKDKNISSSYPNETEF